MSGYNLTQADLDKFRQIHSKTPGHPEYFSYNQPSILKHINESYITTTDLDILRNSKSPYTPGVEATTGPLGTGIGNAVGMALASKRFIEKYSGSSSNNPVDNLFYHNIVVLCGDGCMQEGISQEALSFAAHNQLSNLIVIYDSNKITLDNPLEMTQSENTKNRIKSLNFNYYNIKNGNDLKDIDKVFKKLRKNQLKNTFPHFIEINTVIGKGLSESIEGTVKAHGEGGIKDKNIENLSIINNSGKEYFIKRSRIVKKFFQNKKKKMNKYYFEWQNKFIKWKLENKEQQKEFEATPSINFPSIDQIFNLVPYFSEEDNKRATRLTSNIILQRISPYISNLISGSADLFSSTKNYIDNGGDFGPPDLTSNTTRSSKISFLGRNIHFGIREHAMGAIMNGVSYYNQNRILGATFLAFSDYLRPTIRIAALAGLPNIYIFSHDSISIGEDGPTHQPVEVCDSLRVIPNLNVFKPGDAEELVGSYAYALASRFSPSALILSRQDLYPIKTYRIDNQGKELATPLERRIGATKGGYILKKEDKEGEIYATLIVSGSELGKSLKIAYNIDKKLKNFNKQGTIRVVSMPNSALFLKQPQEYIEKILPSNSKLRVGIENGSGQHLLRFIGFEGKLISVDSFGYSGNLKDLEREFGIDEENLNNRLEKILNLD